LLNINKLSLKTMINTYPGEKEVSYVIY